MRFTRHKFKLMAHCLFSPRSSQESDLTILFTLHVVDLWFWLHKDAENDHSKLHMNYTDCPCLWPLPCFCVLQVHPHWRLRAGHDWEKDRHNRIWHLCFPRSLQEHIFQVTETQLHVIKDNLHELFFSHGLKVSGLKNPFASAGFFLTFEEWRLLTMPLLISTQWGKITMPAQRPTSLQRLILRPWRQLSR